MEKQKIPFEQHIFVCVNDRAGEKCSCGDHKGREVFKALRRISKERGVHPRIRVAQAKCLGKCSDGVNIMTYPDNIWYSGVRPEDVTDLANTFFGPEV